MLRINLKGIFTFTELLNKVMSSLTVIQLKMVIDNRLPVSLDLDIDYSRYSFLKLILLTLTDIVKYFLTKMKPFDIHTFIIISTFQGN